MITSEIFDQRARALFNSLKRQVAARHWKSGKRAGTVRVPASELPFRYADFELWLFRQIGYQAKPCPYCSTPVDILSLSLDHAMPRSRGGSLGCENLQIICKTCNERKGALSDGEYRSFLHLLEPAEYSFLRNELLKRLDAAAMGSRERFFRKKPEEGQPKTLRRAAKQALEFEPF